MSTATAQKDVFTSGGGGVLIEFAGVFSGVGQNDAVGWPF